MFGRCNVYYYYIMPFFFALQFPTASAADIHLKNPGNYNDIRPILQNAVNKANNGDRIILPEGEFLFNRSVTIKKFISIKGQGLKKTILYRSEKRPDSLMKGRDWQFFINYDIRSNESTGIAVSGICFRSKKPCLVQGDGGSIIDDDGINLIECVDFVIEHCRFEYFGDAGISVTHKDTLARGLIRNNEFYYNARFGLGYGVVIYGEGQQWVKDPEFGSSNFIFIENNVFDFHRHSVAAGTCALYVFRFNTVLNNVAASGGHAIDTHEARPGEGSSFGTRAVEIYNNKLLNKTYTYGAPITKGERVKAASLETAGVAIRNGDALVFNNEVWGYRYAATLSNWYIGGTSQPYPVLYGPGYLSGLKFGPLHSGIKAPYSDGDAFFWNNSNHPFLEDEADSASMFYNVEPNWWKEGRDYHLAAKPGYKPYSYPFPVNHTSN